MSKIESREAGFSTGFSVAAILVVLVIGGVGFTVFKKSATKQAATTTSTPEAKDPVDDPAAQPQQPMSYEGYTQYVNQKYGFSFYYPKEWNVRDVDLSTMSEEDLELYLQVVTDAKTNPEAVGLTVSSSSFETQVSRMAGSIKAHDKTDKQYHTTSTFKGKQSAKFTIGNRIICYFQIGAKTYSIQTFNEDTNIARDPDYMKKFNTVVDSLTLP